MYSCYNALAVSPDWRHAQTERSAVAGAVRCDCRGVTRTTFGLRGGTGVLHCRCTSCYPARRCHPHTHGSDACMTWSQAQVDLIQAQPSQLDIYGTNFDVSF